MAPRTLVRGVATLALAGAVTASSPALATQDPVVDPGKAEARTEGAPEAAGAAGSGTAEAILPHAAQATLLTTTQALEKELRGALSGEREGRLAFLGRALRRPGLEEELQRAVDALGSAEISKVRVTSLGVDGTLWFGLVPTRVVSSVLHIGEGAVRVLRLTARPAPRELFGRSLGPSWTAPPAPAIGELTEGLARAPERGRCADLPVLAPDTPGALPSDPERAKKTRAVLTSLATTTRKACEGLRGWPFHRLTWRPKDAAVTATLKDGTRRSMRLSLAHGPDDDLRILHLSKPREAPAR